MKNRQKGAYSLGGAAALVIVGAAIVTIGANTGTQAERCDRFWQSKAASAECHKQITDAEMARMDARSAELQRQIDVNQRHIDQTERNIRDADAAIGELTAAQH